MNIRIVAVTVAVLAVAGAATKLALSDLLPSNAKIGRQANDAYLTVSHQLVRPWGVQTFFKGRPVDLAFDAAKHTLGILGSQEILIVDAASGAVVDRAPVKTASYAGIAFHPLKRELWASEATRSGPDSIVVLTLALSGRIEKREHISLPGHPVPTQIAFNKDGTKAYIALHRDNKVVEIDTARRIQVREYATGLAPFGVVLSPNGDKLYVSNRAGSAIPSGANTALSGGVQLPVDTRGSVLPGTLSVIELASGEKRDIQTGKAPSGIAIRPDGGEIAVANGHSDTVTLIDAKSLNAREVSIPSTTGGLIGSQPVAVAYGSDGSRLYVACGGENAVTVIEKGRVAGAVPTGWFPSALAIDSDGGLRVVNIKGVGSTEQAPGKHTSRAFEGSLLRIPAPLPAQLNAGMREVKAAAQPRFTPTDGLKDIDRLGIEHVFLLIKENRTYDQVFSDLPKGNGDKSLLMYGREVTPNHHALAEQYVLLDNFYATGAISFEGHQWLMMGFVSDHVERALQAAPRGYAWNMADALTVSPAGFFWQGARRPLNVQLLGPLSLPAVFDVEKGIARDVDDEAGLLSWTEYWNHYKKGTWRQVIASKCGVPTLTNIFDTKFPPSAMRIPDQIRADAFLERLDKWDRERTAPNLTIVTMTSDHTMGRTPGAPTPRAMVADNDLALGRIVEGISKSKLWPKSLILVVEDDAQDGVDHVDGHRTIALAIGPYVKRNALDSNFYTQTSMVRTVQDILRIPPRTRFLASARAMNSLFTRTADLTPYKAIPANIPLDTMNPPLRALSGRELWAARASMAMNWNEVDDIPTATLNKILWWDNRGFQATYPTLQLRAAARAAALH